MFSVFKKHFDLGGTLKYTELEYIESTGTQWINTGIKCKTLNYVVEIGFKYSYALKFGFVHQNNMYGTWIASEQNTTLNTLNIWYKNFTTTINQTVAGQNHVLKYDFQNGLYIDNELKNSFQVSLGSDQISNVYFPIFTWYDFNVNGYSSDSNNVSQKCSLAKITLDNTLILDLIPVKDPSGVVCMYDKVSNQFFYNSGTGNFTAGPVVREVYEGGDANPNTTKFLVSRELFDLYVDFMFDKNTGDYIEYESAKLKVGNTFGSFPAASKFDNRFLGFSYSRDGSSTILTTNDTVTIANAKAYAQWLQLISQTFDAEGGQFPDSTQTKILKFAPGYAFSEYTFPQNPTKDGKNFGGWFTQAEGQGTKITSSSICPASSTTYHAHWKESFGTMVYCGQYNNGYSETDIELGEIIDFDETTRTVVVQCNGSSIIDGYAGTVTFNYTKYIVSSGDGSEWDDHSSYSVNWYSVPNYAFDIYVRMRI